MSQDANESRRTFQPLVPLPVQLGIALAVSIAIGAAWVGAGRVSVQTVQATSDTLNRPVHVTLPTVQIITAKRKPAEVAPRPAT